MAFNVNLASCTPTNPDELLNWVNKSLSSSFCDIRELCNGAAYCQLMHMLFMKSIDIKKVNFDPKNTEDYVANFHLLDAAFAKMNVEKIVPTDRLVTGEYLDHLKFLGWFKLFFDANYENQKYDALTARNGQQMGSVKHMTKNVEKLEDVRSVETNAKKTPEALYSSLLKKSGATPTENAADENAAALPTTSDSTPDEKIKLLEDSIKELLKLGFTSEQIFDVLSQDKIEIKDVLELKDANKSYHATGEVKFLGAGNFGTFNVMDDNNNRKYLNLSTAVEFAETVGRTYGTTSPNKIMLGNLKSVLKNKTQTVFKRLNIQAESVKLILEKSEILETKTPGGSIYMIIFCGALLRKLWELLIEGHPCENLKNSIQLSLKTAIKELKSLRVNEEEKEKIKKTEEVAKATLADMSYLKENFFGNNAQSSVLLKSNAKFLLYECVVGVKNAPKKKFEEFFDEHTLSKIMRDRLEWVAVYIQLSGVDIVLTSQHFDQLAIKYFQSQNLMPLTVKNQEEFYRVQRAVGGSPLEELKLIKTDEKNFGFAEKVLIDDTEDGRSVLIETQNGTIIVEDVTFESKKQKLELNEYEDTFVPGSGKTEFRIASKLQELADNYGEDVAVGIRKFGEAVALNFEFAKVSDSDCQKYESYLIKLWSLRMACSIANNILESTV